MDPQDSFFKIIAGENAIENDLSRLFCACFSESPAFAQTVLTTIWRKASISGPVPKADKWICDYQPPTPVHGGGYPDLRLIPPTSAHKPIFLESKVGAKLTKRQLRKYREYGAEVLVAITKNWPEVTEARLKAISVKSLRWQEICRALRQTKHRGVKNKFICDNFRAY